MAYRLRRSDEEASLASINNFGFGKANIMADINRIKEIPDNDMTAAQKKVFADLVAGRGKLLAPYKIWIHSPKLAAAMETIGTFLNKAGSLSEREVELIICIIANHWRGEYVWAAHVKHCLEIGYKRRRSTTSANGRSTIWPPSRWPPAAAPTKCSRAPTSCWGATALPKWLGCWATIARYRWA